MTLFDDPSYLNATVQADNVTHNRQLLLEALWTCSCRRLPSSSRPSGPPDLPPTTPSLDTTERRFPAEVAKHLAQMLVELVTPDVMCNDIPWPDVETVHTTVERYVVLYCI